MKPTDLSFLAIRSHLTIWIVILEIGLIVALILLAIILLNPGSPPELPVYPPNYGVA